MIKTDIVIIGLGITSKIAALTLATDTRKVMIFGQENSKSHSTNLVTFFSLNSIDFLKRIGIDNLVNQSVPIQEISCSKLENYQLNKKFQINFRENELGRVVMNNNLNDCLDDQIKKKKIKDYIDEGANKILSLDSGKKIIFSLLIVADKRSDLIDKNFKKNIIKKELKQTSIVMDVKMKTNNRAFQIFTKKGALALLPINENSASIIWSLKDDSLELNYDIKEMSHKINKIFKNITGFIEVSNLQKFKLKFEFAKKITSNSIILIGDAAHSLHPIAGQGLNLSIKDIIVLRDKIEHFKYLGYALSNSIILDEYENIRQTDNSIYTFATIYLDELLKNRNFLVNTISNLGIAIIERKSLLKNMIIKSATGQSS